MTAMELIDRIMDRKHGEKLSEANIVINVGSKHYEIFTVTRFDEDWQIFADVVF
jgi:hypothetical protein